MVIGGVVDCVFFFFSFQYLLFLLSFFGKINVVFRKEKCFIGQVEKRKTNKN
jgi:hypothetical protein